MPNRKKRLKKGIESLQKQILLHEEKLKKAKKEGKLELADYYEKEVENMKEYKGKKERLFKK
ncbi:MAG: hypothetical protein AABW45_01685 [Nanoarchaeota archaeon]